LRRAMEEDDQIELVGLIRISNREPRFTFRRRGDRGANQLFDGFEHEDEETAEQYDEPVLARLGTRDEEELRDGFPKTTDELYQYDAIVLDDLGTDFFRSEERRVGEGGRTRRVTDA